MKTGTVKFFNSKSNFGFIRSDEDSTEYYVHGNDVEGTVQADDKVSFELKEAKRGPQAVKVKKIS
ncbi:MAG: cold-shock protein [Bacteroidetes bacterium]|jgi:CspA family cold shock protein|nr:cold-shock protein [Bacteroidota bacterium]